MPETRRQFFGMALAGLSRKAGRPVAGGFVFEDQKIGHELRHPSCLKRPQKTTRVPLVIVGGGIAGLSAAWRLEKRGFRDFVLLELAAEPGGNSRSGHNEISAYPWAAHYIPVPGARNAPLVHELLSELGIYSNGRWEERDLCHTPQERLFLHGRWQDALEPEIAATARDREQYKRFEALVQEFRATGRFTIPMEAGATESPLDRLSFAQWMAAERFDSPYLRWYLNYACRDDYGATAEATSAWAGIHYFASREPEDKGPLVWPEGNGWVVHRLLEKVGRFVRTKSMVYSIRGEGARYRVTTEEVEYIADAVIYAAPLFLAPHIFEHPPRVSGFQYSPWLTANLTLDRPPKGAEETAWDNVIYDSPALGYVVATHQSLRRFQESSVWTFYWAFASGDPNVNRRLLLDSGWDYWKERILEDLERAHPDIRQCVSRVDIFRLGHAMVRPVPGFVFGEERRRIAASTGRLLYAHSDVSGFSIFEEAQYRGVKAAEAVLRALGGRGR